MRTFLKLLTTTKYINVLPHRNRLVKPKQALESQLRSLCILNQVLLRIRTPLTWSRRLHPWPPSHVFRRNPVKESRWIKMQQEIERTHECPLRVSRTTRLLLVVNELLGYGPVYGTYLNKNREIMHICLNSVPRSYWHASGLLVFSMDDQLPEYVCACLFSVYGFYINLVKYMCWHGSGHQGTEKDND